MIELVILVQCDLDLFLTSTFDLQAKYTVYNVQYQNKIREYLKTEFERIEIFQRTQLIFIKTTLLHLHT